MVNQYCIYLPSQLVLRTELKLKRLHKEGLRNAVKQKEVVTEREVG